MIFLAARITGVSHPVAGICEHFLAVFSISHLPGVLPRILQSEDTESKKLGHLELLKQWTSNMASPKRSLTFWAAIWYLNDVF
jgi:hypothetical protein